MSGIAHKRTVKIFVDDKGQEPLMDWLHNLKDKTTRAKINQRIANLKEGLLGDCRHVEGGIWELRIHWGPGFRLYYAEIDLTIVLLLCGGTKRRQSKDIEKAKSYWQLYQLREQDE